MGKSLKNMGIWENFLNRTAMAYALRSTINKLDVIKLQSSFKAKNTVNRRKQQPTDWEKSLLTLLPIQGYPIIQRTQKVRL